MLHGWLPPAFAQAALASGRILPVPSLPSPNPTPTPTPNPNPNQVPSLPTGLVLLREVRFHWRRPATYGCSLRHIRLQPP